MRWLVHLIALGIVATPAFGQTPPTTAPSATTTPRGGPSSKPKAKRGPERDVRAILDSRIPEAHFDQAPLEKVMAWLQNYTDAIVYVRWAALEEFDITRETPITVNARGKKLSQVLWVVMSEAAAESGATLAYQASTDLFLFSTHKDLSRNMITRVYHVQDITVDVPEFRADGSREGSEGVVRRTRVRRSPPPPSRSRGGEIVPTDGVPRREISTDDEKSQEFMELILNTIEPESWEVNGMGGKGTIFPYKGRLIVRNSIYVHQILSDTLKPRSEKR